MIERKFVSEQLREFQIQEFISNSLKNVGHSHTKVQRTPLGEKIVIYASRPGLVVGRRGENIKKLTATLKKRFELENPQIEISEVENIFLDAQIVAEIIASTLERFGPQRFKGIGHKMMANIMGAGALGVEILISGKIPGSRAKRWRFYQGYLKKCGDVALGVKAAYTSAQLKSGNIGIKVKIMPPDLVLPDKITLVEEKAEEAAEEKVEEKKAGEKEEGEGKEEVKEEEKGEGAEAKEKVVEEKEEMVEKKEEAKEMVVEGKKVEKETKQSKSEKNTGPKIKKQTKQGKKAEK